MDRLPAQPANLEVECCKIQLHSTNYFSGPKNKFLFAGTLPANYTIPLGRIETVSVRYFLFTDTVSVTYFLYPDTVSVTYFLYPDTVSVTNFLYPDTVSVRYFLYPDTVSVTYFLYPDTVSVNNLFLKGIL